MTAKEGLYGIMKISIFIYLSLFGLSTSAVSREVIKIGGVGSALGSIKMLAADFEKLYPDIKVVILPSLGSSGAIKALSKNAIDIGLCGRPLHENEHRPNLTVTEYAKTPFVFAVHKEVDISDATITQIIKIFRGEAQKWSNGKRIRLIIRPKNESDTLILRKISSEMDRAVDVSQCLSGMQEALTDQENADKIENIPGAFGTSTLTQVLAENRSGIKILSYNGVMPNIKNLSNGTYDLMKRFSVVITEDCSESAYKFIEFMKSSDGKKILEDSGNLVVMK